MPGSVLVVLTHECSAAACLRGADAAAAILGVARIDVLHVRLDPLTTVVVPAEILPEMQRAEIEARAASEATALKASFDAWRAERVPAGAGRSLCETVWLDVTGSPHDEAARRGRGAELIVIGAPDGPADHETQQVLHAALFDTGRPFLRVPQRLHEAFGRHVAVAWKEGRAAQRAATASLPWLQRAERISVMIVEEEGEAPAAGIVELLSAHGLTGNIVTAPRGEAGLGSALLATAARLGADLLVMGAYRRPRIIEFILGGATSDVMRKATIPLLMQH